jgi:hypothetical protein
MEYSDEDSSNAGDPGEAGARSPKFVERKDLPDQGEETEAAEGRRRILITPDRVRMLLDSAEGPRIRVQFEGARAGQKDSHQKVKASRIAVKRWQFKSEQSPRMPLLPLEDIVCK